MRVLIGGVGYRWMRDGSFGLAASDALSQEVWPDDVEVADLGYGALYVALDLLDKDPPLDRLVLIAATVRGRAPGQLTVTRWTAAPESADELLARVREAGAGVIDLDHLLAIAHHHDALPNEVTCIELEPVELSGGDGLSELAREHLVRACDVARHLALDATATAEMADSGAVPWR